jgi:hypothetical protein
LRIDPSQGDLEADRWDSGTSSWNSVGLGSSDWEPVEVDLRQIGLAVVRARIVFSDTRTGQTTRFNCRLARGDPDPLWTSITTEPSSLGNYLDPIAHEESRDATPSQRLVSRSEVQ